MKYMLMMNTMKSGSGVPAWPREDRQGLIAFMIRFDAELRASGELISDEGLSFPDQARLVRAAGDGTPIVESEFPAGKEFLAGYWIINVETPERAYEIAARVSAAPGLGGAPLNMPIEVRPIPGGPPPEML